MNKLISLKRLICWIIAVGTAIMLATACASPFREIDLVRFSDLNVANAPSATARLVTINAGTANIRSGAGTAYFILGTASKGSTYVYLGSQKDTAGDTWYKIQYTPTKIGWLKSSLCSLSEEQKADTDTAKYSTVIITGRVLNVREKADSSSKVMGTAVKGTMFKYLKSQKDKSGIAWYQIQFNSSKTGWVISSYAKLGEVISPQSTTATSKALSTTKSTTETTQKKDTSKKSTYKKTKGKVAYLTFDDGPSANTYKILDILDKYNVKATFFVIYKKGYKKQYQAIVKRGHTIALHSYTHNYSKIYKSEKAYFADLKKIHDYVEDVTGVDSNIIRFPGGSSNTVSNKYNKGIMKKLKVSVEKKGYVFHDWNVDSTDAAGRNRKASLLLKNVKSGAAKKKTIDVLMHDTGKSKKTTVEALPSIIEYLRKQGYSLEALTPDTKPIQHRR